MAPSHFWSSNNFNLEGIGQALWQLAVPAFARVCALATLPKIANSEAAFVSAVEHRINQGGQCTVAVRLSPVVCKQYTKQENEQAGPITQSYVWAVKQMVSVNGTFRTGESIRFEWDLDESCAEINLPCSHALACKVAIEQQRRLQEMLPEAEVTISLANVSEGKRDGRCVTLSDALVMIEQGARQAGITDDVVKSLFPAPLDLPNLYDAFEATDYEKE